MQKRPIQEETLIAKQRSQSTMTVSQPKYLSKMRQLTHPGVAARLIVSVPALKLDFELNCHAQKQADFLATEDDGLQHPYCSDKLEGENVATIPAKKRDAMSRASKQWATESIDWPGGRFTLKAAHLSAHYTQVCSFSSCLSGERLADGRDRWSGMAPPT